MVHQYSVVVVQFQLPLVYFIYHRRLDQLHEVHLRRTESKGGRSLSVEDPFVKPIDFHQMIDLLSDLVDFVAVFPFHSRAEQSVGPVVRTVLYVLQEVHLQLFYLGTIFSVEIERSFGHFKLVPVLIETEKEKSDESYQDFKKSSYIGDQLI